MERRKEEMIPVANYTVQKFGAVRINVRQWWHIAQQGGQRQLGYWRRGGTKLR